MNDDREHIAHDRKPTGLQQDDERRGWVQRLGTVRSAVARRGTLAARLATLVAAFVAIAPPALAQQSQSAPKPTVGEGQAPRQDASTRSGAPKPTPPASAQNAVPKSERDEKNPPGYKKGTSTPRDSDSGSILGTPK